MWRLRVQRCCLSLALCLDAIVFGFFVLFGWWSQSALDSLTDPWQQAGLEIKLQHQTAHSLHYFTQHYATPGNRLLAVHH